MTLWDYAAAVSGAWLILAALGGTSWALIARRINTRADIVKRASYPPPVPHPPVKQSELDETWLLAWADVEPADIDTLEQRVFDRLFDDILAIEGLQ